MTTYWALVTLGPLLIGLSITASSQLFVATSDLAKAAPLFSGAFYSLVSVALTTGAYTLLYMLVPSAHRRLARRGMGRARWRRSRSRSPSACSPCSCASFRPMR